MVADAYCCFVPADFPASTNGARCVPLSASISTFAMQVRAGNARLQSRWRVLTVPVGGATDVSGHASSDKVPQTSKARSDLRFAFVRVLPVRYHRQHLLMNAFWGLATQSTPTEPWSAGDSSVFCEVSGVIS